MASAIGLLSAIGGGLVVFAPFLRSTNSFVPFAGDARVRYEAGAEIAVATIARALPDAITTVERRQFSQFARSVDVYVCANTATFERYGPWETSAGIGGPITIECSLRPKAPQAVRKLAATS